MTAPERELTTRELNRALLARQLLLDRPAVDVPAAIEQVGGIQAQYAPAMYVGLWSRTAGLERAAVTRALEHRQALQATLMRTTIHLVAPGDFWPMAEAVRAGRRALHLRTWKGVSAAQMAGAARTLRTRLRAGGPLHRREIEALLGKDRARGVGLWLDLVRVPPSGTWEHRRADLYDLAETWSPPPTPRPTAAAATDHLVRSYLRAFGPAEAQDVASFTGLGLRELAPALRRVATVTFRGPDGRTLLDVPGAPLPPADTPAAPRFLPVWDATLLVHARRTQILPERYRPAIFSVKKPHGTATFLVDGAVAGAWRHDDGRVVLEPYERLDAAVRRELEAEAERLAAFHAPA